MRGATLGKAWEQCVDAELRRHCDLLAYQGRPEPLAQWTRPGMVCAGGRWVHSAQGWLDLVLWLPGGQVVTVDCKAVDGRLAANAHRWPLKRSNRLDVPGQGHQARKVKRLGELGHRAGFLVGRLERSGWVTYAVPWTVDLERASVPWEELEPHRVPEGARWWESL